MRDKCYCHIIVTPFSCGYWLFFISLHSEFWRTARVALDSCQNITKSSADNVRELEHIRRLESVARMHEDKSRMQVLLCISSG